MIRGQFSISHEGKYTCTRNVSPPLCPTHLVPSQCLYPFGGDNSVLLDSIDPLDSTRLPRLHRWIPSSPCTTQLRRAHRVTRCLIESVAYCTAPTAQLHSSGTTQGRRVRRELHNFVEFILLYKTAKREVLSKGNGRRPGEGDGVIGGNKMAGRGGPFWGPFGAPYPRGGPPQEGPPQSGQAGGPPQGGHVGWGPRGGAGRGAAKPEFPVGAGGRYNQMFPPFGIGGRWGPQTATRGAQPNPRSRWGPPMVPRPPQQQQPRFAGRQQPGFAGQQQPGFAGQQQSGFTGQQQPGFAGQQQSGFAGQQQSGFTGQQQPGFIGPAGAQGWQVPWGGQPMMQGWGPQGGQPPFPLGNFPLGSVGPQIGQLNPLIDITGGFAKEAQRMVDRLVKEMGVEGRKSAHESVLQPGAVKRLSMKNDQLNGTAPASPQRDGLSDMRVAVHMRLLPDSSMVRMAFANNHSTRVSTIGGHEVVKLAKDLIITEWMRVFF